MKIREIEISNFRLLQNFKINLEDELSLVIGKNNTGKTSFLSILEKFLLGSKQNFTFSDLNIGAQKAFKNKFENGGFDDDYSMGIILKLYIEYTEDDDLSNISEVMLNLEPDQNFVILQLQYSIGYEEITNRLNDDFEDWAETYPDQDGDILDYLNEHHHNYFKIKRKAIEYNNEDNSIDIEESTIKKIVNFKRINAKRDVINPDGSSSTSSKQLSKQSSRYYETVSGPQIENQSVKELMLQMRKADSDLEDAYSNIFSGVLDKVKRFGGIKEEDSVLEITSKLDGKNLLNDNTTVMYSQDGQSLPEDYYGLGYLNLISMIFEIEVVLSDFKQKNEELIEPADINLFFIEEPEAHTHPQMQYIFIKNIKNLLEEESNGESDDIPINLQTIISTHSSHITAESDFDDIKYFIREDINSIISKDLKKLKEEYEADPNRYKFLKKYLTLSRAELFFADKAILIEGDTERILMPTIMDKIDIEDDESDLLPLTSQNISIIEVGTYAHIFDQLINFLNIKSLLITDIDSVDEDGHAAKVEDATNTSNHSIKNFLNEENIETLIDLELEQRCLSKNEDEWQPNPNGDLLIVYQQLENDFFSRSFEDAFININRDFIKNNKDNFQGLKKKNLFDDDENSPFDLADQCIKKKTDFALDIIYHSEEDYENWNIPSYIEKGLSWLKKN